MIVQKDLLALHQDVPYGNRLWEWVRQPALNEVASSVLKHGGSQEVEIVSHRPGGDQTLQVIAAAVQDDTDDIVGATIMLIDVTPIRRLEEMRRDFIANVSHELKTPLTAIRGMVETINDDPDMPPAIQSKFLTKITDQSMRLSALITDLLTISRLEDPGQQLREFERCDFVEIIRECCNRLQEVALAKQILLRQDLSIDVALVEGDPEALGQLVDNLISNAIRYTPGDGTVTLRLGCDNGFWVFAVEDTGIGIDAVSQTRIFERFYRVDTARSREVGGTGLGLSIVKHVTKDHGGSVALHSSLGKGSTFTVRLPTVEAVAQAG